VEHTSPPIPPDSRILAISDGRPGNARQAEALAAALLPGRVDVLHVSPRIPWRWASPRRWPGSGHAFGPDFARILDHPPRWAVGCGRQAALATRLPLSGWAAQLARQSEWVGAEDNRVRLRVSLQSPDQGAGRDRLQAVLSEHFGQPLQLDIITGQTGKDTAWAVAQAEEEARRQQAEQAIAEDQTVQAFIQTFDASIIEGSIKIED